MVKVQQAILVEGRYDKNTLSQIVDAPIFETSGFGIFKNKEQMALLRRVAERQGLIVFTDSDGAGFVIRNHIKSAIPGKYLLHAYIPDIPGKERRKAALRDCGATMDGAAQEPRKAITKQDFTELGLSGGPGSSERRKALLKKLELPEHMSSNAMLQAVNLLYSPEEFEALAKTIIP